MTHNEIDVCLCIDTDDEILLLNANIIYFLIVIKHNNLNKSTNSAKLLRFIRICIDHKNC